MSNIIKYKCCIRTTRMLCHAMPNEGSMVSGNNTADSWNECDWLTDATTFRK